MMDPESHARIAATFDEILYDHPVYSDQPGSVRCCGLLVVVRYGVMMCDTCGRKVEL